MRETTRETTLARRFEHSDQDDQGQCSSPGTVLPCACDLIAPVNLSQPTVSHHMKLLVDAGLITREQRGKWAYYRLSSEALAALGRAITPAAS